MKNLDLIFQWLSYDGAATNDPANAVKLYNEIQETTLLGVNRLQFQVPTATVDMAIALPANPSAYLLISTDTSVSIKLDGDSTAIDLTPRAQGIMTTAFYVRGSITNLTVSNSSGSTGNLDIIVANK